MKPLWNSENKPSIFQRTNKIYAKMTPEEIKDRGFLPPMIEQLLAIIPDGVWLAGSWFESICRGEKPKDLDIFFKDEDCANKFIASLKEHSGDLNDFIEDEEENFLSYYEWPEEELLDSLLEDEKTTAITIRASHEKVSNIQLVKARFFDSAESLIDSFDFTVAQFAIGKDGVTFNPAGMLDLHRKRLVLHKVTFPSSTVRRLIKYTKKGYFVCAGSFETLISMIRSTNSEEDTILYVD